METDWPNDKHEAVRRLKAEAGDIQPGQDFIVRRMEPADAWGVARCFFKVYGEHYPFDTYYVPQQIVAENRTRNLISVVARTTAGDIVGYSALFRSSALNPRLYEFGQATVIPEYRSSFAILCLQDHILNVVVPAEAVDGIFGEAVCNHIITQKLAEMVGCVETGIEIGLMPGEAYPQEGGVTDRVSAVLMFQVFRDEFADCYIPSVYEDILRSIIAPLGIARNLIVSEALVPRERPSAIVTQIFDEARVARISIPAMGGDFEDRLKQAEMEAVGRGVTVFQVFVNLGEPWSGRAVSFLRERGYFWGGFLPRWFETDGLLMQRLSVLPDFGSIHLHSARSRQILDNIRADIGRDIA